MSPVAAREDVDVLAQKVQRKGKNTLGLFLAVSGFSGLAVRAHSNVGSGLIYIDGMDLFRVFDSKLALTTCSKRRGDT